MIRFLLLLLTVGTVLAQRTPLYVNGTVVNNPNFQDTSGVFYSVAGADISAFPIGLTNSGGNTIITNLVVINNAYVSNFFSTNITTEYITVLNSAYVSNFYSTDVVVSNNITIRGNGTINSLVITNNLTVSNITFTQLQGTIDATGGDVTLVQRKSLKLQYPRRIDGAGCTYSNTNDFTADLFMVPRFSGTGATNANWARWATRVPADLDTSQDLTASLTVQKNGTATDDMTFTVGMVSIADGTATVGTPANYNTITVTPASATSGAVESENGVTLTGWRSNMTTNQWLLIQLQRDGSDANNDTADGLELEIFYVSSQ